MEHKKLKPTKYNLRWFRTRVHTKATDGNTRMECFEFAYRYCFVALVQVRNKWHDTTEIYVQ